MAYFERDTKYEKAIELVEKMGDNEKDELIKYYIKKKQDYIESLEKKLREYSNFFEQLDKFLPNRNSTIF